MAQVPENIRKLQDTTVTLRTTVPAIYKKLLLKECELEHQQIIETDVCVPKHPIHELNKLERIQGHGPLLDSTQEAQEAHQMLNILVKLFPANNRSRSLSNQQSSSSNVECNSS